MVTVTLSTDAGNGSPARRYPDAEAAILALAGTLDPAAIGRLRMRLHEVQKARNGVAVTPFDRDKPGGRG